MSHGDELLSWHACGRCQHVFLPRPERVVFCPACGAAHGLPFTADTRYAFPTVWSWLDHHGWPHAQQLLGPFDPPGTYQLETLQLTPSHVSTHVVEGHAVLWEEGRVANLTQPMGPVPALLAPRYARSAPVDYVAIRMTSFFLASPSHEQRVAAERAWGPLAALGHPRLGAHGVHLLCHTSTRALREHRDAAARGLAAFSRALGGEPIRLLRASHTPGTMPMSANGEPAIHCQRWTFDATRFWARWQHRAADAIACAICGAPRSRAPDTRCGNCHARLIPSAAWLEADPGEVRDTAAQIEPAQTQPAPETRARRARVLPMILAIGGLLVAVPPVAYFLSEPVLDLGLESRLLILAGVLAGLGIGAWSIVSALRPLLERPDPAWREAFERLGEQLEGPRGTGRHAVGAWCSRWWRQGIRPLPVQSYAHQVFHLDLGGLPAMMEVDAIGAGALRVLVAARWEPSAGALKDAPGVVARRRALWDAGFAIRLRRAGLEMNASAELVARLREDPGAIGILLPVLYEVRRIMALLDARAPG